MIETRDEWLARYRRYLASEDWRRLRAEVMQRDEGKCQLCGGAASQVHHLSYKRLGREHLTDLQALCSECHRLKHGIAVPRRAAHG